jgi:hypothetical protein
VWPITTVVFRDPVLSKGVRETGAKNNLAIPLSIEAEGAETQIDKIIEKSKALKKELDSIMKGERPPVAMLEKHDGTPKATRSLVSFQHVYSLPKQVLGRVAAKANPRLRLLPPYREHISQAFGRYFTRIGLPQDIARYST